MTAAVPEASLVNLREIAEIELFIVKRMKELTVGDHASKYQGQGFNFVGLRDWQPGDRLSSVDWAQSSMNNFSPLVTRQFDQDSNATVVAVADASLSTRCGVAGASIAAAIARSVAAVGLSAVFFQDMFGLITFDDRFRQVAAARPKIGRSHVIYCVDLYQNPKARDTDASHRDITATIASHLRRTSLVPVISDFLFADAPRVIRELGRLNAVHDVFLMMADARFAYQLPPGVTAKVEKQVTVTLEGSDRQLLGEVAAAIRGLRPPEPYKGKGVRYAGEHIRRKAGKAAAGASR